MEISNLIGSGFTSDVYMLGTKYVVKLLKPNFSDLCEKEYKNYKTIENSQLSIPKCYDLIEYKGRKGLVLDYIQGVNFTTYIKRNPHNFINMLNKLTDTFIQIISLDLDNKIENKEGNNSFIKKLKKVTKIRPEITNHLIDKLLNDNFDNLLIHGDFNPLNVIVSNGRIFTIDFAASSFSDMEQDLAKFRVIYNFSDYSNYTNSLIDYLSMIYRPFIYQSFINNLKRRKPIDTNKLLFWQLVHISIATDEMENLVKINSNLKLIEQNFKYLNK